MKIIETTIQKRFTDIDTFRHVNNVHQQDYFDLGKTDYYRRVLGLGSMTGDPLPLIVSVKSDFAAQVHYEDDVVVRTWVERIGNKSLTVRQQIVARHATDPTVPETVCTEGETVLVAFDSRTQLAVEVPVAWREKIL